jgi:hypothetical protein
MLFKTLLLTDDVVDMITERKECNDVRATVLWFLFSILIWLGSLILDTLGDFFFGNLGESMGVGLRCRWTVRSSGKSDGLPIASVFGGECLTLDVVSLQAW